MRIWSIHPKYLDRQGLLAVWREGLLAQKVLLQGEYGQCCKGLWEHDFAVWNSNTKKLHCVNCGKKKIKTPYYNHPQLERFRETDCPLQFIVLYLKVILQEGINRGYNFRGDKIEPMPLKVKHPKLTITTGQLKYEFNHLQDKLWERNRKQFNINMYQIGNSLDKIEPHLLFKVVEGDIEGWEKIK